jgi:hypothetical protein
MFMILCKRFRSLKLSPNMTNLKSASGGGQKCLIWQRRNINVQDLLTKVLEWEVFFTSDPFHSWYRELLIEWFICNWRNGLLLLHYMRTNTWLNIVDNIRHFYKLHFIAPIQKTNRNSHWTTTCSPTHKDWIVGFDSQTIGVIENWT